MTYTAKTAQEFRNEKGTLSEKICSEFGLISSGANITVASGDLASGLADAYAFTWQNPETVEILIYSVTVDITTAGGTGSSVLNVDVVANATSTGDTILDGVDLNSTGISVSTNVSDSGTSGDEKVHKADENGGTNDYVTGKILVANASALVGKYYIQYTTV